MNEIKKQLMAKMGDTSEQKNRVIKKVNDSMGSKLQKDKKFAWGYYVTFASFVGIFVIGLLILPNLMNEQASLNEENPSVVDPVTEPTEENGYYDELIQFFPPNGTVATYDVVDFYSEGSVVTTKWLSDRYVLQVIKSVNCPECSPDGKIKIYRITDEQIELISDGGDSRTDWTVEELDQLPSLFVELKAPIEVGTEFNGLSITNTEASVTTQYGEFTNAILVEEIENYEDEMRIDEYNLIEYYVPGYGIVKSDVTSHHSSSSELVSISFGNEVTNESDYNSLLKSYFFPSEDSDAFYIGGFENGGEKVQTKWINNEFVQEITSNGGATVERIYKIRNNQIDVIYEEMIDESNPSSMTIAELEGLPTLDIVMKAPFTVGDIIGDWTVLSTSAEVGTMYSTFSEVLLLESKTENSISRKYYAKGFGEVKLETEFYNEETSQYEVGIGIELSSFGPIMKELEGNVVFRVFEEHQYDVHSIDEVKTSPLEKKRAILHVRGEDFEGINKLVIEDLETGKFTIYKYRDEGSQFTPKVIEWIDENRLYVIVGYGYGTVTMGGQLYELDLVNHSITPVFGNLTDKEEIMSIKANGDGTFTYEKHIYEDEEYSVGHVEEGIISPTK